MCRKAETVGEDSDLKTRDSQVVQHLAQFMISDPLDGLYVDHDLAKADQVGDILSNFDVSCRSHRTSVAVGKEFLVVQTPRPSRFHRVSHSTRDQERLILPLHSPRSDALPLNNKSLMVIPFARQSKESLVTDKCSSKNNATAFHESKLSQDFRPCLARLAFGGRSNSDQRI